MMARCEGEPATRRSFALVADCADRAESRPQLLLLCVFRGGEFRGGDLSDLAADVRVFARLVEGLGSSSLTSTLWPLASLPGDCRRGCLADWAARRRKGGRMRVQALGLILAAPFVFATGFSTSVAVLIAALDRGRDVQRSV